MSRRAKTLVERLGEEERAARSLWVLFALAYGVMLGGAMISAQVVLVLAFLLLYALEAAWRPILLARFDMASEEKRGATLLSIESQVRSLIAMVLAPGLGDQLQASKAGIMEIASLVVVNKADRDGADVLAEQVHAHTGGKPVFKTNALKGDGLQPLFDAILGARGERRLMEAWLSSVLQQIVRERISPSAWEDTLRRLKERSVTPYDAADALLKELK